MDRPTSRSQLSAGEDVKPGIARSATGNTARKPVTKPGATSTTATRPSPLANRLSKSTAASATRAAPTTTSSLSKPPTRPTLAATARNSVTSATAPSTTVHEQRGSGAAYDSKATDDESQRDGAGIAVRPKRMVIAPSTVERTTTSRQPAPMPVGRTSTATSTAASTSTLQGRATSPAVSRSSVKSPTNTSTGSASTARPTIASSVRPKPATSSLRSAATVAEKKRLGTIPPSPAVHLGVNTRQGGLASESGTGSPKSVRTARPPLGTRKSSHSVLMEQRIREFELVNQMLQQAMAAEGHDPAEQEALDTQAAETMNKLRTTLGRVRKFEKEHGRKPSEAELDEVSCLNMPLSGIEQSFDPNESAISASASVAGDHTHTLKEELNESRAYASQLEAQVQSLTGRLREYGELVEAEGEKVTEDAANVRDEHANSVRSMSIKNQARLDHLRRVHDEEIKDLQNRHQEELTDLRKGQEIDISNKDDELQRVQEEVRDLKKQKEADAKHQQDQLVNRDSEIQNLREQVNQIAKQNTDASGTHSKEVEKLQSEISALVAKNMENENVHAQIEKLEAELEQTRNKEPDTSKADAEIAQLKIDLEEEKIKTLELSKHLQVIDDLKSELELAKKQGTDALDKDAEIARLKEEVEKLTPNSRPVTSSSASRDTSPIKPDAEKEELRVRLAAIEKRHQAAKENAKTKAAKQAEEHAAQLAEQVKNHETALVESRQSLEELRKLLDTKHAELEGLKTGHAQELAKLNEQIAKHVGDLETLSATAKDAEEHKSQLSESVATIKILRKELADLHSVHEEREKMATSFLDAAKDEHARQLTAAQAQIGALKAEVEAAQNQAIEASASAGAEHAQQLDVAQKQLSVVQAELDQLKTSNSKIVSEEILILQGQIAQAQDELTSAKFNHDQKSGELQAQLDALRQQAEHDKAMHETASKIAQAEVESVSQSYADMKFNLETQLEIAEKQLREMQSAMEAVKIGNSEDLAKAAAEINKAHDKEIATLNATHGSRLKQLEEEGKASIAALEELEQAHNTRVSQLQAEAASARDAALQAQSDEYTVELRDIKAKSDALAEDLEALQIAHVSELEDLRVAHATAVEELTKSNNSEKQAALKALQDEHAAKLTDLETQSKGLSDDDLAALQESHAEHVRKLESQNKDLMSQVEGFRFQLQTMKGIFADQENQAEAKEQEHEKELQFEKDQFSQAVLKISNHGAQLAQKDAEHDKTLNAVRTEMQAAHDKALDELTIKLKADHAAVVESMKTDHHKAMKILEEGFDAKNADLEKLAVDHAEALGRAQEHAEAGHKEMVLILTNEHSAKLDALKAELHSTHEEALASARADHESTLTKQRQDVDAMLASLKDNHEGVLSELRSELASSKSTKQDDDAKIDLANTSLAETRTALLDAQKAYEKAIGEARSEHERVLQSVHAANEEAISKLQSQLADAQAAEQVAAQAASASIPAAGTEAEKRLEAELAAAESRLEAVTKEHQSSWVDAESQHAKALQAIREELDNVRQQLADRLDQAAELDALKKKVEQAATQSKAVVELEDRNEALVEKHAFLADEAEQQSQRADATAKEMQDLRKAVKAADTPTSAISSGSLSNKLKSRSNSALSNRKTSSGGLQFSRWATTEPMPPATTFAPAIVSLGLHSQGETVPSEGGRSKNGRTERNVHGQLAGINEDIRNLHSLSERMLAENRRMAKTLSRVDDRTVDTVTVDEE